MIVKFPRWRRTIGFRIRKLWSRKRPKQPTPWARQKATPLWIWRQRWRKFRRTIGPALIGVALGVAVFAFFTGSQPANIGNALADISAPRADDPAPRAEEPRGLSVRVIDGDTIEDRATGERIRLANIDTPETGDRAQCAAERQAGERAKQEARAIVRSGAVTVERTGRTDRYGRTIGFVSVDGRDLGRTLIERGLARPWRGRREPWCSADGSLLP